MQPNFPQPTNRAAILLMQSFARADSPSDSHLNGASNNSLSTLLLAAADWISTDAQIWVVANTREWLLVRSITIYLRASTGIFFLIRTIVTVLIIRWLSQLEQLPLLRDPWSILRRLYWFVAFVEDSVKEVSRVESFQTNYSTSSKRRWYGEWKKSLAFYRSEFNPCKLIIEVETILLKAWTINWLWIIYLDSKAFSFTAKCPF